ncbi:MAG: hypothetical protein K8U57_07520 [Planctomycetes bacterium]|nr:hypothetical protein [Planctomycetota bacterium]
MTAYAFGSGTLIGVRTDIANQTPAVFGVVQDAEIDFDFSLKELIGQYQAPVAIARGALKITGKAKAARIYGSMYNSLFFAQTQATGGILQAVNESGSIPTTPYQITVANSSGFLTDLGVFNATTGVQLTRVASGPTTGQYSVSAGVYTFAAADTGLALVINYSYSTNSGATKITLANQLQGSAPTFQINLAETYNSKVLNIQLNANVASKLSFPFKNQDFVVNDFEWQSMADAAGNIGYITCSE